MDVKMQLRVLIETLWNVKSSSGGSGGTGSSGINRNIVECKESIERYSQYEVISINRNIVECKVF